MNICQIGVALKKDKHCILVEAWEECLEHHGGVESTRCFLIAMPIIKKKKSASYVI